MEKAQKKNKRVNSQYSDVPLTEGWSIQMNGELNGLESTENRRSDRRNGNQHVHVRHPQVSGARTARQSPVSNGGPFLLPLLASRRPDDPWCSRLNCHQNRH